jgi:hypothetical protein
VIAWKGTTKKGKGRKELSSSSQKAGQCDHSRITLLHVLLLSMSPYVLLRLTSLACTYSSDFFFASRRFSKDTFPQNGRSKKEGDEKEVVRKGKAYNFLSPSTDFSGLEAKKMMKKEEPNESKKCKLTKEFIFLHWRPNNNH